MRRLRLIASAVAFAAACPLSMAASPDKQAAALPTVRLLTLEAAERVMAVARAQAEQGAASTIVIVDASGEPVLLQRMTGAPPASAGIAAGKARTALSFGQSTTLIERAANSGRAAVLSAGYVVMQGGEPIVVDRHVIGALGVSGGTREQDEAVAKAAAAILDDAK